MTRGICQPAQALTPLVSADYISDAGKKGVLEYKYSGTDLSLYYKHVASPLAQAIVDRTPGWIAPNCITATALSLVIASYVTIVYYIPKGVGEPPSWVYAMCCFCLFGYQILDVADGKQARATGNSSPLGTMSVMYLVISADRAAPKTGCQISK